MTNPWLAIDVATAPKARARELRRAWEQFVGGNGLARGRGAGADGLQRAPSAGGTGTGAATGTAAATARARPQDTLLRAPIADSWRRSAAAGVDPSGLRIAPQVADEDETSARWEIHPLAQMAPLIRSCLAATADESQHLIVVSDANGVLLWVEGNATVRLRAAEAINFAEGTLWSEPGAGTNAIGTAIAAEHAVQVFASEHFNEVVQQWTCAAAPVHDPDTGRLIGVIDLTGDMNNVHPHSMAVATATAQAVEAQLRCEMLNRDARMLARYGDRLLNGTGPRALITPSGRVIAAQPVGWLQSSRLELPGDGGVIDLGAGATAVVEALGRDDAYLLELLPAQTAPRTAARLRLKLLGRGRSEAELDGAPISLRARHAEILTLLSAHHDGLSTEQLSVGVYGSADRVGAVRVEISRLRKLLGDCIDTEHYRLAPGVTSDVATVIGLLHRGDVREAAARYPGPLLPRSSAPGVIREREALEGWLRQSVMSSGDKEALWEWLQTPTGSFDLPAWQRLLANLAFQDPRRSLAASRIAQLRIDPGTADAGM